MSEIQFTDKNFEEEALKSDKPVLVDFFAPWCGPCQMMMPVIEELAKEYEGKIKIGKLNVDENTETAKKYQVMSIPTLVFIKDGEVADKIMGARNKEELKEKLDEML